MGTECQTWQCLVITKKVFSPYGLLSGSIWMGTSSVPEDMSCVQWGTRGPNQLLRSPAVHALTSSVRLRLTKPPILTSVEETGAAAHPPHLSPLRKQPFSAGCSPASQGDARLVRSLGVPHHPGQSRSAVFHKEVWNALPEPKPRQECLQPERHEALTPAPIKRSRRGRRATRQNPHRAAPAAAPFTACLEQRSPAALTCAKPRVMALGQLLVMERQRYGQTIFTVKLQLFGSASQSEISCDEMYKIAWKPWRNYSDFYPEAIRNPVQQSIWTGVHTKLTVFLKWNHTTGNAIMEHMAAHSFGGEKQNWVSILLIWPKSSVSGPDSHTLAEKP